MVSVQVVTTPDLPPPAGHYAHAVRAGGLLFISGLLGVRPEEPGDQLLDAGAQAAAVLRRLGRVLAAAGLEGHHVARLGVYVTDVTHWVAVNAACAAYFGPHRPARTILTCPGLHHASLIEVDAVAVFPEPVA
ncbi:RidA family protein [Roseomonas sp. KE2513]|nr:RidA family protein [Roseomonas sp. KE2513]